MLFEGDIEMDDTDNLGDDNESFGDFVTQKEYKWNTRLGPFLLLPYTIPQGLSNQDKAQIAKMIWMYRSTTCVK